MEHGFMNDLDADVCGDFFDHIDDLLDFPSDDFGTADAAALDSFLPPPTDPPLIPAPQGCANSSRLSVSLDDDLAAELSVPCEEEIAQLEWLSNFVEDSFSSGSMDLDHCMANFKLEAENESREAVKDSLFRTSSPVSVLESSSSTSSTSSGSYSPKPLLLSPNTFFPGRTRTKRPRLRPHPCTPFLIPPAALASDDVPIELPESLQMEIIKVPPKKKKAVNSVAVAPSGGECGAAGGEAMAGARKCVHCGIQKTPQWRMGPMGPKTLCNACGVRYKSGRLYPEYRPAASPTFCATIHSNSHKKVIEMRVKSGQTAPAPVPEFVRKNAQAAQSHMLHCA